MISSTGPYSHKVYSEEPVRVCPVNDEAKAVAPEVTSCPPPPSLESRMIEYKVAQALPKVLETRVNQEDCENFKRFLAAHLHQVVNFEQMSVSFLNNCGLEKVVQGFVCLFDSYKSLAPVYLNRKMRPLSKQEVTARENFISCLCYISYIFSQICNRDMQTVAGNKIPVYKRHYQEQIHPSFLILQRLTNFLHVMLEREGAIELLNPMCT